MTGRKNIFRLLTLLLLLVAAFGCQRRPLETMYRPTVRTIIRCVWDIQMNIDVDVDVNVDVDVDVDTEIANELSEPVEKPSGVTLYFFRDGAYHSQITTSSVDSVEVQLEPGKYRMYMISQSPEEYWRMEFEDMTSFNNAATTLREATGMTWAARKSDDEVVVENPEVLFAGVSDEFEITEQMTEDYQYYYTNLTKLRRASQNNTKGGGTGTKSDEETYLEERVEHYTIRIPIQATNVVSQLWVTIYSGNADVLQSVRASTSGMARTFELTQNTTAGEQAIQVLREWKLTMDDTGRRVGHVDGLITTFGLPNGETPSAQRDSALNVSALLIDTSTVADYVFDVGDKIQKLKPNTGYRHLYRLVFGSVAEPAIVLPDVKPDPGGGGGGFVANVEDWAEEENVDLIL